MVVVPKDNSLWVEGGVTWGVAISTRGLPVPYKGSSVGRDDSSQAGPVCLAKILVCLSNLSSLPHKNVTEQYHQLS